MEESRIVAGHSQSNTLRTTVPRSIAWPWHLKAGSELQWHLISNGKDMFLGVIPSPSRWLRPEGALFSKVSSASSEKQTLRTTIPAPIAKHFRMEAGQTLTWELKPYSTELVAHVEVDRTIYDENA